MLSDWNYFNKPNELVLTFRLSALKNVWLTRTWSLHSTCLELRSSGGRRIMRFISTCLSRLCLNFNDAFYSYLVGVFECCDGEHEVAGGKVGALAPGTQDNQTVGHSLELEWQVHDRELQPLDCLPGLLELYRQFEYCPPVSSPPWTRIRMPWFSEYVKRNGYTKQP